jgi:hypothetical protein
MIIHTHGEDSSGTLGFYLSPEQVVVGSLSDTRC